MVERESGGREVDTEHAVEVGAVSGSSAAVLVCVCVCVCARVRVCVCLLAGWKLLRDS